MTTLNHQLKRDGELDRFTRPLIAALGAVACALLAILLAYRGPASAHGAIEIAGGICMTPVVLWLFLSERYERTIGSVALYLGLLDGVVKLTSGSNLGTLVRDILLYTIVAGTVARFVIRRERISFPPLTWAVAVWLAVCVVQVANPSALSLLHSVASLRQDLEFVPLFFFGTYIMRSEHRLVAFLKVLVIIGVLNGLVDVVQSRLTPSELATWGPGYSVLENGTGTSVARVFYLTNGQAAVRPPGLGGEDGFGGLVGMMAMPALIALATSGAVRQRWVLVPAAVCILAGVITSQTRLDVVSTAIAIALFALLTATTRRGLLTLSLVLVISACGYAAISIFTASSANRYASLNPSHLANTAFSARQGTIRLIPGLLRSYPLGAGLGLVGPAAGSFLPAGVVKPILNGESEFTFLIVELGIPGLLSMLCFTGLVARRALRLRKIADPRLQHCLMALTAVFITLWGTWFFTPVSADSPGAPFVWFSAGVIVWWAARLRRGELAVRPGVLRPLARV